MKMETLEILKTALNTEFDNLLVEVNERRSLIMGIIENAIMSEEEEINVMLETQAQDYQDKLELNRRNGGNRRVGGDD